MSLADLFIVDGEDPVGAETGQNSYLYSYKSKPKNCAGDLDLPPLPRQKSNFVGLENQGATCYLNSLLQTLYLTPQLRAAIFQLPLCESNVDEPSEFLKGNKRDMMLQIQKLFTLLSEQDARAISTSELTKTFGWENNEQFQQHDVQELNRILFDIIERALKDTVYESLIDDLYRGTLSNLIICQQCGISRKREEKFLDLVIQVKGLEGVDQSLKQLFEFDRLEGDNKLFCDNCNEKTDTLKGCRIQNLPPILTLDLLRFDFDYQTFQRKKLNDKFEYPLELNMTDYLDPESVELPENTIYELKSVIIHRGGAYGGHYHAYIQDELYEGNWHLQMPTQFQQQPKLIEKKAFNPQEFMTEEQIKQAEEQKDKVDPSLKINVDDDEKQVESAVVEQEVHEEKKNQVQSTKANAKLNRKERKQQNKQSKQGQNQGKQSQNQNQNQKNKNQNKGNQERKQTEIEYDFDECDFPLPYSEKRLIENWYDFNDSSVTPILPGKLQSQFGGQSENAYLLVYRQKKLCTDIQNEKKPEIPSYWKPYVSNLNEVNNQQRQVHGELENQLDIILQDEVFFKIDEQSLFIRYMEDAKIDEQGIKVRIRFTDTISEVKAKIYESIGETNVNIIQIERLRNANCQLLMNMNHLDENSTIKDAKISHLSTWIVVKDPQLIQALSQLVGEDVVPINLKLSAYGKDAQFQVYNNIYLDELMKMIEAQFNIPLDKQSIKVVEETVIRRIDRQILNKDNPNIKNKLKDLKIVDNSAILIEIKDENDVDPEDTVRLYGKGVGHQDIEDIDSTENIRTVIVNTEFNKEDFTRYQINIDWDLQQLTVFLIEQLKLESPQRIRNLTTSRLFVREELETKLRSYDDFQIGGARLQIEEGRYPTMAEMVIKVSLYQKEEELKQLYIHSNATVKEFKTVVCKEFNGLEENQYTLFRVDGYEDPAFPLRRENQELSKCHVANGDLLILKKNADILPEERLFLNIHMTMTGQPDDSQYIEKIEVNREYTLSELKEIILSMPQFEFAKDYPLEQIRVREKQQNMFFGKIFREHTKSLKQLQMKSNSQIVIQVLQEPELLDNNTFVLLICKRLVREKLYSQKLEFNFNYPSNVPKISDLEASCRKYYGLPDDAQISIAKYVPHLFEWKWMNPEEILTIKKKKKESKVRSGDQDLRQFPFMLKDGDIIGVRFEKDNEEGLDDFQTEEDLIRKQEWLNRPKQDNDEPHNNQSGKKKNHNEVGLTMNVGF